MILVEVGANTSVMESSYLEGFKGHVDKVHIRLCVSARAQGKKVRLALGSAEFQDKRIHEMLQASSHLTNSNMASTLHSGDAVELYWHCLSPPIERNQ